MKLTRGQSLLSLALLGAGIDALARRPSRPSADETLTFSPDGRSIARSNAGGLSLYDAETREVRWSVAWKGGVTALAFSADSSTLAALRSDNQVTIRDVVSGVRLQSFPVAEPDQDIPGVLALSPKGDRLAVADIDGTIALFQTREGRWLRNLKVFAPQEFPINDVAFSENGDQIVTLSRSLQQNLLSFFRADSGERTSGRTLGPGLSSSNPFAFFSFGFCIAYAMGNSKFRDLSICNISKNTYVSYGSEDDCPYKLEFASQDFLIGFHKSNYLSLIDTKTSREIRRHQFRTGLRNLTVSPNGKKLAYLAAGQLFVTSF